LESTRTVALIIIQRTGKIYKEGKNGWYPREEKEEVVGGGFLVLWRESKHWRSKRGGMGKGQSRTSTVPCGYDQSIKISPHTKKTPKERGYLGPVNLGGDVKSWQNGVKEINLGRGERVQAGTPKRP